MEREERENILINLFILKVGSIPAKIDLSDLVEVRLGISKSICQVSIAISDFIITDSILEIEMSELCVLDLFFDCFDISSVFVVRVVLKDLLVLAQAVFCAHSLLLNHLSCEVHKLRTHLRRPLKRISNCKMLDIN